MSNVQIQGLMSAHRKNLRSKRELAFHQNNELRTKEWTKEDKTGRCYVYRGVEYCY